MGLAEFPTFWMLAPLAGVLILRALLQRAEFRWSLVILTVVCGMAGAVAAYGFAGWAALRFENAVFAVAGVQGGWGALEWFIRSQMRWMTAAMHTSGWLLVMGLTGFPWCVLFLLRAKKPAWRYGYWQVFLRLAVLVTVLAAMFGAPITPWHFFGMAYLMVTPMAILAACLGYVAGEFLVMGQTREHRNAGIGHIPRKVLGWVGAALPLAVVWATVLNGPLVDARKGQAVTDEAKAVVEGLSEGDVVLTDGVLDELIEVLAAAAGKQGITLVGLPRTGVDVYRSWLGMTRFQDSRSQSLLALGFGPFLQDWLLREGGDGMVALNTADQLRAFGETASTGLTSRLEDVPTAEEEAEANRPFRERMEALAEEACPEENPGWGYRQWLLRAASKQANNTGFRLLEEGEEEQAEAVLLSARKMDPRNLSVLLNLLGIAVRKGDESAAARYRQEWEDAAGPRIMQGALWRLASEYGYVYNTGMLIRQGMMWAVSGRPKQAEAELRRVHAKKGKEIDVELKAFFGQMYLFSGDQKQGEEYYRAVLEEKPDDPAAIHALAQLAIQQGRLEEARAGLGKLRGLGIPPERFRFDELLIEAAEGEYEKAVKGLEALAARDEEVGVQVWGAIAVLAGKTGNQVARDRAIGALLKQKSKSLTTRLLLAHLLMGRKDWSAARAELEQLVRMNPSHAGAWEMLLRVDYAEHKKAQAEDHVRVLLTLDPQNAFGNLLLASFQRERGQLALAESSYRAALATQRTAPAMNDLADLLMRKPDGRAEARALLDEALALVPGDPTSHMTRAELNMLERRMEEAEKDLQTVLGAYPGHPDAVLLAARLYAATGRTDAAAELVHSLEKRKMSLSPENQDVFRELQTALRNAEGHL